MLGFVENIGHKYDFQGGVGQSLVGGGDWGVVVLIQRKSFNRLLIHISNVDG